MVTRRTPKWLPEVIAWSAALVLFSGVGVVASGAIGSSQHRVDALGDTPTFQVTHQQPVAQAPQTPKPAKVFKHQSSVAVSVPTTTVNFGPPPGPQNDRVPTAFAPPGQRWALLVGITHYKAPTHPTLAGANDVVFIRSYLISQGWLNDHIMLLTDQRANGIAVRRGLAWLVSKSKPGTFTLFHYSGHVKQDSEHEYLWPWDHDLISNDELSADLRPGTGKMWVDIAGCEAAGFIEHLPSSRVLVSVSSKVTQKSYEHPYWHESIWVGLMWDAGLSQGQADANRNGVTTMGEALRFAAYWAPVITYNQQPHGPQSPRYGGMSNILGWTLADPPA